jgi:hypothetical protein
MSVRIMSAIWEIAMPPTDKLVLLALADAANDEGYCWPSISTIARKSGVSERSVQRAIRKAETDGLVKRQEVIGKGCKYWLAPRHSATPDTLSPVTPATPTPDTVSPKPSRTIIPKKDKPSLDMRASKFVLPDHIPSQPWVDFEDMRRRIGKPMTQRAKELAVMRLDKLAEDGWPPGDVLNHSTLNSYQGLFPPKDDRHGRQSHPLRGTGPDPDGLGVTARAALSVFGPVERPDGSFETGH